MDATGIYQVRVWDCISLAGVSLQKKPVINKNNWWWKVLDAQGQEESQSGGLKLDPGVAGPTVYRNAVLSPTFSKNGQENGKKNTIR